MKPSTEGIFPHNCELKLFDLKTKQSSCPDLDSPLRKLYVDLCNLIVESRIPGVNERGYGEGIHCPPATGSSTHSCNLSAPECQNYQKLIQRLLRGSWKSIFDIEVLLLPECCHNDQELKLSDRIAKKEYIILERWSLNCHASGKIQQTIDASQLLRAVRSFLYFSQLSAWLSSNKGKSPSNVYYWIKTPAEVLSTKFDIEPEVHKFPTCNIGENLCGNVNVKYRPRTQYVPIIPCSKHPPLRENPLISNVDKSESCQNMDAVKLLRACDTCNQSTILTKANAPILVLPGSNVSSSPMKTGATENGDTIIKSKKLKFSNSHSIVTNILGSVSNLPKESDKSSLLPFSFKPHIENLGILPNIYSRSSSQGNVPLKKRQRSVPLQEKETKQRKFDDPIPLSVSFNTEAKRSRLKSLLKDRQENKKNLKRNISCLAETSSNISNLEPSLCDKQVPCKKMLKVSEQNVKATPTLCLKLNAKRKLSTFYNNASSSTSHNMVSADSASLASTTCSYDGSQEQDSADQTKKEHCLKLHLNNRFQSNNDQEGMEVESIIINNALKRVENNAESTSSKSERKQLECKDCQKSESNCTESAQQAKRQRGLPLPSSPVPLRNIQQILPMNSMPSNCRRKLFQSLGSFPKPSLEFNKTKKLLGTFEESILKGCLRPVSSVDGFTVEIGARGNFFPDHITLPADVYFYEIGGYQEGAAPYVAHVTLGDTEYFVPKKGAVQVTLFNPSETVVQMFIVNYDFTNMPPLCHTFVRQKTYYMPSSATENDPSSQKWLRYIIHLRFASSKSGKIFLHKDFKLVVLNKSDVDAASIHSEEPHNLRSFIYMPSNPEYSKV